MTSLRQRLQELRLWQLFLLVLAVCVFPRVVSHFNPGPWRWTQSNADVALYQHNAECILSGQLPYRDVVVEYPPVALLVELLPGFVCMIPWVGFEHYADLFMLCMALVATLTIRLTEDLGLVMHKELATIRIRFLLIIGIMSIIFPFRLDVLCACVIVLVVILALRDRAWTTGLALGAGFLLKLFPLIYLIVASARLQTRGGWKQVSTFCLSFLALTAFVLGSFYLLVGDTLWVFVRFHAQRPLQIESTLGAALLLVDPQSLHDLQYTFGADHIVNQTSMNLARVLPFVSILALAACSIACWIRITDQTIHEITRADLLVQSVSLLSFVFICTSKVFSPQYLIWLIPMMCLTTSKGQWKLFVSICALTMLSMVIGTPLIVQGSMPAIMIVSIRNVMVIILTYRVGLELFSPGSTHPSSDSQKPVS